MSNNPYYKILSFRAALILMAFTSVAGSASAAVILSTDFTGRIIANNTTTTATNVIWTANGVSNPGTSLSTSGYFLRNTAATAGYFAPVADVSSNAWDTSFSFTVTDSTIQLGSIVLVVNHFNAQGALSASTRDSRYIVKVTGSISGQIADNTLDTPLFRASLGEGPKTLSFNYDTPLVLNASETYTVRIDSTKANTSGVFSGIDSITLNSIPEPTLPSLLGVFGVLLLLRRRR